MSLKGDDLAVGDSAVLYIQIDSDKNDDAFAEVEDGLDNLISKELADILVQRKVNLYTQVKPLKVSPPFSDERLSMLIMTDVPFDQYIGNDQIDLHDNTCIAVGDFATVGIVFSDDENPTELPCPGNCLHPYILSIEALRKKPSMYSFIPRLKLDSMYSIKQTRLKLEVTDIDFFYQRYDEAAAMDFVPECHGDTFTARSSKNIILGDYLNVATLGFVFSGTGVMNKIYTYSEPYNNSEWVSDPVIYLSSSAQYNGRIVSWAADTVNVVGSAVPKWQSQKVVDVVNGSVTGVDFSSDFVEGAVRRIFFEDGVAAQMTQDMYRFAVAYETGRSPDLGSVCSAADSSLIPLDTETDYVITNILEPISEGLTPSPTVTAMPSSSLDPRPWYPLFSDSSCRNDGNEEYFMEISIDVSTVVEKPMVEVANALSHTLLICSTVHVCVSRKLLSGILWLGHTRMPEKVYQTKMVSQSKPCWRSRMY